MKIRTLFVPFALVLAPVAGCKTDTARPEVEKVRPPDNSMRVAISVTENGFEPDKVAVKQGVPTTVVFTRKTDNTCAKQVVFEIDAAHAIRKDLPLDTPVEIAATFPKPGEIRFACGMDMVSGVFTVQ